MRRQSLEVGTDLVGSVAPAGNPIRADDDDIHLPVLHEMPARIVRDQRMGHAVPGELPRREACTLVTGTGFVDPHMYGKARVVRRVHGRQGRPVVHEGQPARVAMRQDVDGGSVRFLCRQRFEQRFSVFADALARLGVFVGDGLGCNFGDMPLFFRGTSPRHGGKLAVNGPCQIGGRGAGSLQGGCGFGHERVESFSVLRGSFAGGKPHAVSGCCADEPRTSDEHVPDGVTKRTERRDRRRLETMGQHMLVNDMQAIRLIKPDRPIRFSVYVHFLSLPIGYFYVSYP